MRLNAIVVDPAVLGHAAWTYLEKLCVGPGAAGTNRMALGDLGEPEELLGAPAELLATGGIVRRRCLPHHPEELAHAFGRFRDIRRQEVVDPVEDLQARPP